MAGLSTKAIKNRIKSMNSTRQITKAMELVATSKLRSAQARAVAVKPYFETFLSAMRDIASSSGGCASPYLKETESKKPAYIVIAGDRGLAGGYNANVFRMSVGIGKDNLVVPIGKRSVDYFKKREYKLLTDNYVEAAALETADCYSIANLLAQKFLDGEIDSVFIIYTDFKNIMTQTPSMVQILPISLEKHDGPVGDSIVYEPSNEAVFSAIVPEYLGGLLYGTLCTSIASEQASRRAAMNSATKNADEIMAELDLQFNRARQGAITQEITEIVAGSNAQS